VLYCLSMTKAIFLRTLVFKGSGLVRLSVARNLCCSLKAHQTALNSHLANDNLWETLKE